MSSLSQNAAQDLLADRLRQIREHAHVPLLSMDLDDTFLPFGQPIGEAELDLLLSYTAGGGHFAFNTLAPKEWLYLRVIERLVNTCSERNRTHLLSRVHWIVSGGSEIFVYDVASRSYRRILPGPPSSKASGLLSLLRHLDGPISLLALFGDRFDDPGNDGN